MEIDGKVALNVFVGGMLLGAKGGAPDCDVVGAFEHEKSLNLMSLNLVIWAGFFFPE